MPTLADLNHRFASVRNAMISPSSETESIICDFRSNITPSQAVEKKLRSALIQRTVAQNDNTNIRKPK